MDVTVLDLTAQSIQTDIWITLNLYYRIQVHPKSKEKELSVSTAHLQANKLVSSPLVDHLMIIHAMGLSFSYAVIMAQQSEHLATFPDRFGRAKRPGNEHHAIRD